MDYPFLMPPYCVYWWDKKCLFMIYFCFGVDIYI